MAADQVRQASKLLGPLLRRRGTSPALGAALRKALSALDKSLGGLDAQGQEAIIAAAIADLRACVQLIAASDRPADHEQLGGIEAALAVLAPAEPAAGPAPSLASQLPVLPAAPTAKGRTPRRQRKAPGAPVQAAGTVDTQLVQLIARVQFLHAALHEPLVREADVAAVRVEVDKSLRALGWLGGERVPEVLAAADRAAAASERIVMGAALLHMGNERGLEWLASILEHASAGKRPLPEVATTVLATLAGPGNLAALRALFLKPATPAVCGALLPLLAEHGLVPSEKLWELVGHASDELAVPAALALAWTAGSPDAPMLTAWAAKARTPRRAHALLFAAAGLGDPAALDEIRGKLRLGTPDVLLVDALAVAGGWEDAALLLDLAAREEGLAVHAVLAAAHLGSAATLPALSATALVEQVPPEILREARRMIVGSAGDEALARGTAPRPRLLRGQPWTVSRALALLGAADEPLPAQRRLALELRVRTGLPLPATVAALASPEARQGAHASLHGHFAKAAGRLGEGEWCYQGRPLSASLREASS